MGTRTGQSVIDRARYKALDQGATKRWDDTESLMWVNDGQLAIVNLLPKAYTKRAVPSAAASTRQDFAGLAITDGITIVDVPRNFASNGTTPGRPITRQERVHLDEQRPTWHTETASEAQHWMYDPSDPKAFSIYPAITGGGKLEVIYSATPADLGNLGTVITLDDIYANALQWFVLFSWFSKDLSSIKSQQFAASYRTLFEHELGLRESGVMTNAAAQKMKAAGA